MDVAEQVLAVRRAAGLFEMEGRGVVIVRGDDRIRWLDGMLSANVSVLEPGPERSGCYATFLTPKGSIIADLHVLLRQEELWLECAAEAIPHLIERLERYIIADDVELTDGSGLVRQLALEGPAAQVILGKLADSFPVLAPQACVETVLAAHTIVVAAIAWSGESGFRLFVPKQAAAGVVEALVEAGGEQGLIRGDCRVLEILRIEAGTPLLGAELREGVLPAEARLDRAISVDKGCYVGQEIVARLRSRGHVNHLLVGLRFEGGEPPPAGADIEADGRRIGEVTSSCRSPSLGSIGLGFVRAKHAEPGSVVSVAGTAVGVTALPHLGGGS